jgi:hypothetical protein
MNNKNMSKNTIVLPLDCFPEIVSQGHLPLCVPAGISAIATYYVRRRNLAGCLDTYLLYEHYGQYVRENWLDNHNRRSCQILLDLWQEKGFPFHLWTGADKNSKVILESIRPQSVQLLCSKNNIESFISSAEQYILLMKPLLLDIPLMVSSTISFETAVIPEPFCINNDKCVGRHIVCIVGFSDTLSIQDDLSCSGAFLIRNCWGAEWGQEGYGWIPYSFFDNKSLQSKLLLFEATE